MLIIMWIHIASCMPSSLHTPLLEWYQLVSYQEKYITKLKRLNFCEYLFKVNMKLYSIEYLINTDCP